MIMINCKWFTGFFFHFRKRKIKKFSQHVKNVTIRKGWIKQKQNSRARFNHLQVTLHNRQQLILKKG